MKKRYVIVGILILFISIIVGTLFICNQNKNTIIVNNDEEEIIVDDSINDKTEDILAYEDGNIAYITIESIGLIDAPIKDGADLETLAKAIGHFKETPYFSGNICLAAHNRGNEKNFFQNLKNIKLGDEIVYKAKYFERTFVVSEINEIEETNLDVLKPTSNNQLTMITCIENQGNKRLCVVATERI